MRTNTTWTLALGMLAYAAACSSSDEPLNTSPTPLAPTAAAGSGAGGAPAGGASGAAGQQPTDTPTEEPPAPPVVPPPTADPLDAGAPLDAGPPPPPEPSGMLCIFDYDLTLSSSQCPATEGMPGYSCRQNTCPTYGWFEQCLGVNASDAIRQCVERGAFIGIASHAGVDECWNDKVLPVLSEQQLPALTESERYDNPLAPGFSYPAVDNRTNWNCPTCAYHMEPGAFKPDLLAKIMTHYGMDRLSPIDRAKVIFWDDAPGNISDVQGAMPEVRTVLIPRNQVAGEQGGCGITSAAIAEGWDGF